MKTQKTPYVRNIILGLIVTAFFLWLALRGIDFELVDDTLAGMNWFVLGLPMVFWGIGLMGRAMRWRLMLGDQLAKRDSISIVGIVYMINATVPFRAGELARLYLVSRTDKTISGWTVLTTVLTETILDMLAIVLLLAMVIPLLAVSTATVMTGLTIGVVVTIGFIMLLVFAHRPALAHAILNKITNLIPPLKRFPFEALLDKLLQGISPLADHRKLLLSLFWTVIIWGCSVLALWSGALAIEQLSLDGELMAALVLVLVATSLGAIIPFTMAGVGPFEAGFVFALGIIGVSQEVALTFGIIIHVLMILHFVLWGMIGIAIMRLSLIDIRGIVEYIRLKLSPSQATTDTTAADYS